jgi:uncharacterized protein
MTQFLHGVEVIDIDAGPRPIQTVKSAVIGIVGTAPDAQPEVKATLNTGLVASNNALTFTAVQTGTLGNDATVTLKDPAANNAALAVVVTGRNVVVNLATGATGTITSTATAVIAAVTAAAAGVVTVASTGASSGAGVVTATAKTSLAGGLDEAFPLDTPVLVAGSRAHAAKLGTSGTLPGAMESIFDQCGALVVVVRVAEGAGEDMDADTLANVLGGVNSTTGQYEGVHAFLGAESIAGYSPRILVAPGFTHQRAAGERNAVTAELLGIAERLRAIIVKDAPNTTDADAYADAGDWGSKRIYLHDPFDKKVDASGNVVTVPASPRIAGQIAKTDNELGFWHSPSNKLVNGIVGTARPIEFQLGDYNARANLLNEHKVATTIRQEGFRLWGNRTTSDDSKWAFLSVVRIADILNDSVLRAHQWAVDRNITKTYIQDVLESVNAYMRYLTSIGAILGGKCYADPDLNTPENVAAGRVFFDFDFTAPAPAERVTFRSHMVNDYIKEIF